MSMLISGKQTRFDVLARFASRPAILAFALGLSLGVFSLAGCKSNPATEANPADASTATDPNADPAAANLAPVDNSTQVAGQQQAAQPTEQGQSYSNAAPAPIERSAPSSGGSAPAYGGSYDSGDYSNNPNSYDAEAGYQATLTDEQAQQPPPPLPEYAQPPAPDPDSLWTPGYWGYAPTGYYWVPGAWVAAPYSGALWTPGYWGYSGGYYHLHHGFWGPHIGFYGGVNYGFGYVGLGYQGGYWNGPHFFYNQYANNINISLNVGFAHNIYQHNVTDINNTVINNRVVNNTTYNNTTINNRTISNVSYNGGSGGIQARPRPAELAVLREPRVAPMAAQVQVQRQAASNPQQFYSHNQGRPALVAAPRVLAADRVAAPPHTTAEIQRAPNGVPVRREAPALAARPEAARPEAAPGRPAEGRPNQPAVRPNRPNEVNRPAQPAERPTPQVQHPQPAARPAPQAERPAQHPQPAGRPAPQAERPAPQVQHPQPAARPEQQTRPQPQARPEQPARSQPQARPAPQQHPQPQPQQHPQKPEQHNQAAVRPQAKPPIQACCAPDRE